MTLTVDTRRAFRTPDELAGLVKAVAEAPAGTDETNWVEFKTGLDLEKPHGKFTAATAILAFANRSPKVAAHACEGVAYVIVGAEPQTAMKPPQSLGFVNASTGFHWPSNWPPRGWRR
jgi:hypothetical protein